MSDRGDYYRGLAILIVLGLILRVLLAPILWPFWLIDYLREKKKVQQLRVDQERSRRQMKIRDARLAQSLDELKRKALKAVRRQNLYTQEELDLADVEACALRARVTNFLKDSHE